MRWRVLGSYNPREQWRCIDWVRRKELFCANICTLMNIHYHTNLNNLRQLAGSSWASLHFSPHIQLLAGAVAGHCVPALRWAVRQRRPRSHGLLLFNRWGRQTTVSGARSLCKDASAPVTTDCDYAIRPSWTSLRRGVNNWRNSPAKSWRLIGCAPGHQVTPRLRALFCAGASGDSPPLRAFPRRGTRWLIAFARFSAQGHQVTPRLRALFRAGAPGDSSPSRAFPRRGIRWLLAFARFSAQGHQVTPHFCAPFHNMTHCRSEAGAASLLASGWATEAGAPCHLEWVREQSPLHTAAADVRLVSCE